MYDFLKRQIEKEIHLSDSNWALIVQSLQFRELHKNEILLRSTDIANYGIFLVEGILRICNHYEGREFTRNIFTAGDFFTESGSFIRNQSLGFQIDAIEKSKVFLLPKNKIEILVNRSTELSKFFRVQMEKALEFLTLRILNDQKPALERFLELRKLRPQLIGRVPQYILASYLNLTPEAYSRIQKRAMNIDTDQEKS